MAGPTLVTRFGGAFLLLVASPAAAQTVPFADTEDATLSDVDVAAGNFHPIVSLDLRNGDYARGGLDDDASNLQRVPAHVAIGFAAILARDASGAGSIYLIGQSSNGFHSPRSDERASPRAWYERNNLLGVAWRPVEGLTTAALYTIKTSPNGVAGTTHEASLSVSFSRDDGIGRLQPNVAVTVRPKGGAGVYTIAGISPDFPLGEGEDAPSLSVPVTIGVGWDGFYEAGSGDRVFGSGGVSVSQPMMVGGAKASLSAELLMLVRDDGLRMLDAGGGTTATIVPLGTVTFRAAW